MNRFFITVLVGVVIIAGCAVKRSQFGVERLEQASIEDSSELRSEIASLTERANALLDVCTKDKFTSKLTYERLSEFFESASERDAFVATFSKRLREAKISGDKIKSYKIEMVAIETNEVVGFVRSKMRGHFWGPFSSELTEVIVWKKVGEKWYVWPHLQQR